jgi:zinc protease
MQDARIKHSLWMRLYLTPAYGTSERRRIPAVEVFAELLGGGPNSLLYTHLVRRLGLAAEVSVAYTPDAIDQATLAIVAVPAPGVSVVELEEAINREVTRIRVGAIEEADVQRVQKKLRARVIRMRDGTMPAARVVGPPFRPGRRSTRLTRGPLASAPSLLPMSVSKLKQCCRMRHPSRGARAKPGVS